jgi:hypothetical protein
MYREDRPDWLKIKNRTYSQAEGRHEMLTRRGAAKRLSQSGQAMGPTQHAPRQANVKEESVAFAATRSISRAGIYRKKRRAERKAHSLL